MERLAVLYLRVVYALGLERWLVNDDVAWLASRFVRTTPLVGGLAGAVSSCTLDVVVKTSDQGSVAGRMQCKALQTWREARLFQQLLGGTVLPGALALLLSTCRYAAYNVRLGSFAIVMDRVEGTVLTSRLGEQRLGAPEQLDEAPVLTPLFDQLAVFHHASSALSSATDSSTWLKGADWLEGEGKQAYEGKLDFARACFAQGKQARAHLLSPRLLAWIESRLVGCEDNFDRLVQHVQLARRKHRLFVTHGDFHAGNVMLQQQSDQFVFLDLSEVGFFTPEADLAQFLLSNVDGKWYSQVLLPTVHAWYTALSRERGSGAELPFTLNEAFCFTLIAGLNKWTYLLAVLLGFPSVHDDRIAYWASNLEQWLELADKHVGLHTLDHECFLSA